MGSTGAITIEMSACRTIYAAWKAAKERTVITCPMTIPPANPNAKLMIVVMVKIVPPAYAQPSTGHAMPRFSANGLTEAQVLESRQQFRLTSFCPPSAFR
jgi:hypothetical protein